MSIGDKLRRGINPRNGLSARTSNYQGSLIGANGTGADTATDIQDQRALSQSGATALGNSVVRLGANILGEVMGAGANVASMWRDERSYNDTVWDIMKTAGDDLKESAAENFEILSTSDDKGLQWSDAVNPKFWANTVEQFGPTIAMMAVSMGAAGVASKGLLGMMKSASPTMAKNIAIAQRALDGGLAKTATGKRAVDKLNKYKQLSNTVSATAISRSIESGMEATQAYEQIRETLKADGKSEEEARNLAAQGASDVYKANWALAALELMQFDQLYNSPIAKGILGKVPKGVKGLGAYGSQMLSEGLEEGLQYAFTTEAEAEARGRDTDIMKDYFKNDEFWESVVQGALGGVVFQGIGDIAGKIGQKKEKVNEKLTQIEEDQKTLENFESLTIEEQEAKLKEMQLTAANNSNLAEYEEFNGLVLESEKIEEEVASIESKATNPSSRAWTAKVAKSELIKAQTAQKAINIATTNKENVFKEILEDNTLVDQEITEERLQMEFHDLGMRNADSVGNTKLAEYHQSKFNSLAEGLESIPPLTIGKYSNKLQKIVKDYNTAHYEANKATTKFGEIANDPDSYYEQHTKTEEQKAAEIEKTTAVLESTLIKAVSENLEGSEKDTFDSLITHLKNSPEFANAPEAVIMDQIHTMLPGITDKIAAIKATLTNNPSATSASALQAAEAAGASPEQITKLKAAKTESERKIILDQISDSSIKDPNDTEVDDFIDDNSDPVPVKTSKATQTSEVEAKKDGEQAKQKALEDKVEELIAKDKSLRDEDGSVSKENMDAWKQNRKEIKQAEENARRGNMPKGLGIAIRKRTKDGGRVLTGEESIKEEVKIEALIQEVLDGKKTAEEVLLEISNNYGFLSNDLSSIRDYINDRTTDAPEIGNNKQSFAAWRRGEFDIKQTSIDINTLTKEPKAEPQTDIYIEDGPAVESSIEVIEDNPEDYQYEYTDFYEFETTPEGKVAYGEDGKPKKSKIIDNSLPPSQAELHKEWRDKHADTVTEAYLEHQGYNGEYGFTSTDKDRARDQFVLVYYREGKADANGMIGKYPKRIILGRASTTTYSQRRNASSQNLDALKREVLAGNIVKIATRPSKGRLNINKNVQNDITTGYVGVAKEGPDGVVRIEVPNVVKVNGEYRHSTDTKDRLLIPIKGAKAYKNMLFQVIPSGGTFAIIPLRRKKVGEVESAQTGIKNKLNSAPDGVVNLRNVLQIDRDILIIKKTRESGEVVFDKKRDGKHLGTELDIDTLVDSFKSNGVQLTWDLINKKQPGRARNAALSEYMYNNLNQSYPLFAKSFKIGKAKVSGTATPTTTSSTPPPSPPPDPSRRGMFSTKKGKGRELTPEILEWFRSRFPNFPILLLEDLTNIAGTNAWGVFTNAAVKLKKGGTTTEMFHEAMHVMTEIVLTPTQRKQVMDQGLIAYNKANPKNKITKAELEASILGNKEKRSKLFSKDNTVDYSLKAVEILNSDKAKQVFAKGKKNNWDLNKILTELQIPKQQKQIILDGNYSTYIDDLSLRENIIISLQADNTFVVEVNTAGNIDDGFNAEDNQIEPDFDEEGNMFTPTPKFKPTQYYSNLSAPGSTKGKNKYEDNPDWEYQEVEFYTPAITPSIKGHAQFSTDNGIGWARIWYNKKTGAVEIQEVQSDLFQKGRDKKVLSKPTVTENYDDVLDIADLDDLREDLQDGLITQVKYDSIVKENTRKLKAKNSKDDVHYGKEESTPSNQFLQLLNKKGNWVNFFIQSIVQDSVKKGYEKVLFPTGGTAAKVEGHQTIADDIKQINQRLKNIDERIDYIKEYGKKYDIDTISGDNIEENLIEKEKLESQKQEMKTQGLEKLKPVEAFYTNRVTNILNKLYDVKKITDEYGNTWNEVTITPEFKKKTKQILLSKSETVRQSQDKSLDPETRILEFISEQYGEFETRRDAGLSTGNILKRVGAKIYNFFKKLYYMTRALVTDNIKDLDELNHRLSYGIGTHKAHPQMEDGTMLYSLKDLKATLDVGKPEGVSSAQRLHDSVKILTEEIAYQAREVDETVAENFDINQTQYSYANSLKVLTGVATLGPKITKILENMVAHNPKLMPIKDAMEQNTEEFARAAALKLKEKGVKFKALSDSVTEALQKDTNNVGREHASWMKAVVNPKNTLSETVLDVFHSMAAGKTAKLDSYGLEIPEDATSVYLKFLRYTFESINAEQMLAKLRASPIGYLHRIANLIEQTPSKKLQASFFRLAQKRKVNPVILVQNKDIIEAINANDNTFKAVTRFSIVEHAKEIGLSTDMITGQELRLFLEGAGLDVSDARIEEMGGVKALGGLITATQYKNKPMEVDYQSIAKFVDRYTKLVPEYYQSSYRVGDNLKYGHRYTSHIYMHRNRLIAGEYSEAYRNDPLLSLFAKEVDGQFVDDTIELAMATLYEVDAIKQNGKTTDFDKMTKKDYLETGLGLYFHFGKVRDRGRAAMLPLMGDGHTTIAVGITSEGLESTIELLADVYEKETARMQNTTQKGNKVYEANKKSRWLLTDHKSKGENAREIAVANVRKEVDLLTANLEKSMKELGIEDNFNQGKFNLKTFVADTLYNQIIYTLLYTGDPAHFKTDSAGELTTDFYKRFKQVYSPGEYLDTDAIRVNGQILDTIHVEAYNDNAGESGNPLLDIEVDPELVALGLGLGTKRADGKTYATVQDGGSIIDPFASILRLAGLGKLDMPQTKEEFMELLKTHNHIIYKPFYFGMSVNENNIFTPTQKKDSEVVFDPEFAYHNPEMAKILRKFGWLIPDKSKGESIDGIDFQWDKRIASILGTGEFIDLYAPHSAFKIGLVDGRSTLSMKNWRAQLATENHVEKGKTQKLAVQLAKLIMNDLPAGMEEDVAAYQKALIEKTTELQEELNDIFNNDKDFREAALAQMEDFPLEIQEAFRSKEIKMDDPQIVNIIQPILTSIIRNKVTNQKVSGNSMYNVSPYGLAKENIPKVILERDSKGNITKVIMETWIPEGVHPSLDRLLEKYMGQKIPLDEIPDGFREMMMYRIPTEDKYSMFVIRPIGILPRRMGNGIIMPVETPDISGFDFDIDKLFGFQYQVDANGNKIESIDNTILDYMIKFKHATPIEGLTPGGAQQIESFVDTYLRPKKGDTPEKLQRKAKIRKSLGITDIISLFGVSTQMDILERLLTGANNIGIAANANSANYLYQSLEVIKPVLFKGESKSSSDLLAKTDNLEKQEDSSWEGVVNNVSRNIAEILAQAVDNLKKPIAGLANINSISLPVIITLLKLGRTLEEALLLVNQKEFREFSRKASGMFAEDIKTLLHNEYKYSTDKYKQVPIPAIDLKALKNFESNANNLQAAFMLFDVGNDLMDALKQTKYMDTGTRGNYAQLFIDHKDYTSKKKYQHIKVGAMIPWATHKIKAGLVDAKPLVDSKLQFNTPYYNTIVNGVEDLGGRKLNVKTLTALYSRAMTHAAVKMFNKDNPNHFYEVPLLIEKYYKELGTGKFEEFINRIEIRRVTMNRSKMRTFSLGNLDKLDQSYVMDMWQEMYEDPTSTDFAVALADYQMIKSGYELLPGTFWTVMPLALRQRYVISAPVEMADPLTIVRQYYKDYTKQTDIEPKKGVIEIDSGKGFDTKEGFFKYIHRYNLVNIGDDMNPDWKMKKKLYELDETLIEMRGSEFTAFYIATPDIVAEGRGVEFPMTVEHVLHTSGKVEAPAVEFGGIEDTDPNINYGDANSEGKANTSTGDITPSNETTTTETIDKNAYSAEEIDESRIDCIYGDKETKF